MHVEIRKGYLKLIGKVDGERADSEIGKEHRRSVNIFDRRILNVSLVGFINSKNQFVGGTKELPLIGNETFLVTKRKLLHIHNLVSPSSDLSINISKSEHEGFDVPLPIDGLFNSHIAIFGNTGSGKSNTLAALYSQFIQVMRDKGGETFAREGKILLFDFNGEYGQSALTNDKTTYNLSTRTENGDKIPFSAEGLLDIEVLAIIADATEKTQQPFLKRALSLRKKILGSEDSQSYLINTLKKQVTSVLQMSDKIKAFQLLDYFRQIFGEFDSEGNPTELAIDITWHDIKSTFYRIGSDLQNSEKWFQQHPEQVEQTKLFELASNFILGEDVVGSFITFCYIQLIYDLLSNRAQNEHIAPVINKLKSKQSDLAKLFSTGENSDLFRNNIVVINLSEVNLEMRKTIPLLLAKTTYTEHKKQNNRLKTLNIIIDEAHNILSHESFREAESWKDYRLETFEEIIKEGQKFGVFVTIASQRPSDISSTITSQAHNYFIHRLVNQRDLSATSTAVSYIDALTEESIPTLPTGTCVFSGVASQMPLFLLIR